MLRGGEWVFEECHGSCVKRIRFWGLVAVPLCRHSRLEGKMIR